MIHSRFVSPKHPIIMLVPSFLLVRDRLVVTRTLVSDVMFVPVMVVVVAFVRGGEVRLVDLDSVGCEELSVLASSSRGREGTRRPTSAACSFASPEVCARASTDGDHPLLLRIDVSMRGERMYAFDRLLTLGLCKVLIPKT